MKYTIPLTLSTHYVSHWKLWEAIRELLQNAMDQERHHVSFDTSDPNNLVLRIHSYGGILTDDMLLLGNTSKSDDKNSRGVHGEGFKLAFLILARLGHKVSVVTGSRVWIPAIREHEHLKKDCLHVDIEDIYDHEESDEVVICIEGLSKEDLDEVNLKYLFNIDNVVATDGISTCFTQDTPRLYVGGLYVCDLKDRYGKSYRYSYDIHHSLVKLDRDRSTYDDFYVSWASTDLFVKAEKWEELAALAADECLDISDYSSHYSSDPDVIAAMAECAKHVFIEKHDEDTVPIDSSLSSEEKALRRREALSINKSAVEVKPVLFKMLPDEMTDIPENAELRKSILEKLQDYLNMWEEYIPDNAYTELEEIIEEERILRG